MQANDTPGHPLKSTLAVLAGFFAVVVLSLGTDQVLHMIKVYPPWGEPMYQPNLNLLALSYRILFTIIGGYLTAKLAPRNPMRHVLVLSIIGLIMGVAGVDRHVEYEYGSTLVSNCTGGDRFPIHVAGWDSAKQRSLARNLQIGCGFHIKF